MNKKKYTTITTGLVGATTLSFFFFNGTQDTKTIEKANLCNKIVEATTKPTFGRKLSSQEIINHASNRFGYGISPIEPYLSPLNANDKTVREILCNIADELVNPEKYPLLSEDIKAFARDHYNFQTEEFVDAEGKVISFTFNPVLDSNKSISPKYETAIVAQWKGSNDEFVRQQRAKAISLMRNSSTKSSTELRVLSHAFGSQYKDKDGNLRDRQVNLNSLLQEFWFNHFNISKGKTGLNVFRHFLSPDGYETTVANNMHGTFHSLLKSVIFHPAMLHYLDNTKNTFDPIAKAPSNQNLGRELLELHTFLIAPNPKGVYDQGDVETASLLLSGITFNDRNNKKNHLSSPSNVICGKAGVLSSSIRELLGKDCSNKGSPDVEATSRRLDQFLAMLSSHKRTKYAICHKLSNRFIGWAQIETGEKDDIRTYKDESKLEVLRAPVVDSCIAAWGASGDLTKMYEAIVTHPNIWSSRNYHDKLKNPLELVVSGIRAAGHTLTDYSKKDNENNLVLARRAIAEISYVGLPYRNWTTPDGYKEGHNWLSQGYLVKWAKASSRIGANHRIGSTSREPASAEMGPFSFFLPWMPSDEMSELFNLKISERRKTSGEAQVTSALILRLSDSTFIKK